MKKISGGDQRRALLGARNHARRRVLGTGSAVGTVTALTLTSLAGIPAVSDAATPPPSKTVSTAPITARQLLKGTRPTGLTKNFRFAAPAGATRAPAFTGHLKLAGSTMGMVSDAKGGGVVSPVAGKDTHFFPNVSIPFFTLGSHLVPTTQDVIRNGVLPHTRSYWDVIVQPGRVWTQRGDHGWHRASFPFALVNSIEGETHTGIALFLYRGHRVSHVRYQVVQETAPYDVPEYFSSWGTTAAAFRPGIAHLAARRRQFAKTLHAQWRHKPLSVLRRRGVAPRLINSYRSFSDVIQSAAVVNKTIYHSTCPTSAGPLPYCNAVRYGVWSVTKTAMNDVTMMHLAQRYGASFINERIATYLPAARKAPGWAKVTFADLANMASGHGPAHHHTCYLCDYSRWYLAPSAGEKTAEALDYPKFTQPGTLYNYRDQDAYLLMAAETAFLKAKRGRHATIARMLQREVYDKIGIYTAPANRTVERRGPGMLVGAYGFYPTVDDLAKISRLFQNDGRWHSRQILNAKLIRRLYPSPGHVPAQALPENKSGSFYYLYNWHLPRIHGAAGCTRYVPQMEGWGGNTVTSMPGKKHVTLIRIRNNWVGDSTNPQLAINQLARALAPICR